MKLMKRCAITRALSMLAGLLVGVLGCAEDPTAQPTTAHTIATHTLVAVVQATQTPTSQPTDTPTPHATPTPSAATRATATRPPAATPAMTPLPTQPTPRPTPFNLSTPPRPLFTPGATSTPAPTATPLPTFAVPAGFPTETPAPAYLAWARPGPYRSPYQKEFSLESFKSTQPLVTTYFFYWYDVTGRAGGAPPRAGVYPYRPVNQATMSFLDPAWYEEEFSDMLDAGIDFVLPDYWGEVGQYNRRVAPAPIYNYFATQGLPPMIEALERLRAREKHLKLGLFIDTTIGNNEDLTTQRGKEIFYATIRDYYSRIPPYLWAAIDHKPVVWLYDVQRVGPFNQSTFDYIYEQFPKDFGGLKPYIVREWQWHQSSDGKEILRTEGLYAWGAAPFGFNEDKRLTIAQVGPGFSNTQFGGTGPNRIFTDREGGKFYEANLKLALRSRRKILAIETWNELGEASGILETVEYGRLYIELTRKYVDMFKAGKIP